MIRSPHAEWLYRALVVLAAVLIASAPQRSLATCADSAAVAATRSAADQACTGMGAGCSTAKNHGNYVSCIAHQARAAVKMETLPKDCKGAGGKVPCWLLLSCNNREVHHARTTTNCDRRCVHLHPLFRSGGSTQPSESSRST